MILISKIIATIIQSLPNKSDLDIYALDIPNMLPPKIISRKNDEANTPDMLVKSKDTKRVFSLNTDEYGSLNDSFLRKARLFSLNASEHIGMLYIAGGRKFIALAKPKLKGKYENIDFLTIQ